MQHDDGDGSRGADERRREWRTKRDGGGGAALAAAATTITITQFTEDSIFCTSSDIVYSMTLTPTTTGTPTSFITFISTTRVVSW